MRIFLLLRAQASVCNTAYDCPSSGLCKICNIAYSSCAWMPSFKLFVSKMYSSRKGGALYAKTLRAFLFEKRAQVAYFFGFLRARKLLSQIFAYVVRQGSIAKYAIWLGNFRAWEGSLRSLYLRFDYGFLSPLL